MQHDAAGTPARGAHRRAAAATITGPRDLRHADRITRRAADRQRRGARREGRACRRRRDRDGRCRRVGYVKRDGDDIGRHIASRVVRGHGDDVRATLQGDARDAPTRGARGCAAAAAVVHPRNLRDPDRIGGRATEGDDRRARRIGC